MNSFITAMGEPEYLNALFRILSAPIHENRTTQPSRSIPGLQLRFPLTRDGELSLPLLTTKKMSLRIIFGELAWFIRGDTDVKHLRQDRIHIWDGDTNAQTLESRKLPYREYDAGPVYGFQWRHWNAEYQGCEASYEGKGIDQLAKSLEVLRTDPFSRRNIVSAWNVGQLNQMALPPCHMNFQWYVGPDDAGKPKFLTCIMTQRSGDMPLGVPYNIVSYGLLTHMVAKLVGLVPRELVINIGDAHVYQNQIQECYEQCRRRPKPPPKLKIAGQQTKLEDFKLEDFIVEDYNPAPAIEYKLTTADKKI